MWNNFWIHFHYIFILFLLITEQYNAKLSCRVDERNWAIFLINQENASFVS